MVSSGPQATLNGLRKDPPAEGSIHTRAREAEMDPSIEAYRQCRPSTLQQWRRQGLGCDGGRSIFGTHQESTPRPTMSDQGPRNTTPKPSMSDHDQVAEHRKQMTHNLPTGQSQHAADLCRCCNVDPISYGDIINNLGCEAAQAYLYALTDHYTEN